MDKLGKIRAQSFGWDTSPWGKNLSTGPLMVACGHGQVWPATWSLSGEEVYSMPALLPLLAGLLEANSCMVSRMYLCGFTGVS
jgi:hypothetical protein